MKGAIVALALAVAAEAAQFTHSPVHRRNVRVRQDSDSDSDQSDVPAYNFTMPVDHFDSKNKHTYPNRYFVNDTYYQPGGPVIFFDNGEAGFDPASVSDSLAEASGASLPVQLAANLSGLVIGWEHRYYGYSLPVEIDEKSQFPKDGPKGYKYLTVEQALADVAYFANNFNQTKLDQNKNVQSTAGMDPYSVPWIFIGGSYPGARAAWMRVKYPEIIYASWASSAPLQEQLDGSPYYNPIMRSIPQNCTNDIKAAIKYMDGVLDSSSDDDITLVKVGSFLANNQTLDNADDVNSQRGFDVGGNFASALTRGFQDNGPGATIQITCDWMEGFDVDQYNKDLNDAKGIEGKGDAMINNPGGKDASDGGIAASNGQDGGKYAFAAFVYGIVNAVKASNDSSTSPMKPSGDDKFTETLDDNSWNWQCLSQIGILQGSNTDNITSVSKYYNFTALRELQSIQDEFSAFKESELPKTIDNKDLLAMGGWDMTVSNVMFANGEFDPWRAFSVASQEGSSSNRQIVKDVPGCNAVFPKEKAFGITYLGAVHAEDLSEGETGATLVDGKTPLRQGLELFLEAWNVWAPCFNQSRDSIRNGNGVDGKGNDATGKPPGSGSKSGAVALMPLGYTAMLAGVVALFVY